VSATRKPLKLLTVPRTTAADCEANARDRREIANRQLMALSLAHSHCGFGHAAYGRWQMCDRTGALPDRFIYCCRKKGGSGWEPPAPAGGEWDERLGPPFRAYFYEGGPHKDDPGGFGFRWECRFNYLEEYEPATADELKAALAKRKAKAEAENAARLAADAAWRRRNETPGLYDGFDTTGFGAAP
jgi:hypothetical protein